ncbi:MAG TPA: rod shape-determining protein MreD [Tepidisphaeraceae bacterium]|nr:rod shape-determining protein MreD [Tepidisphaeraceae bacterium]
MRWLAFSILAYLVLGIQSGAGTFVAVGSMSAQPNLVLIAVIFVILNAPHDEALLGAVILGALQDLVSSQPFGLFALSYGITAVFLTQAMQAVYRDHPVTHFVCVLFGGFVTAVVITIHGWVHPQGAAAASAFFASAVYSAVLAPVVLWGMQRSRRFFGFQPLRRTIRPY